MKIDQQKLLDSQCHCLILITCAKNCFWRTRSFVIGEFQPQIFFMIIFKIIYIIFERLLVRSTQKTILIVIKLLIFVQRFDSSPWCSQYQER